MKLILIKFLSQWRLISGNRGFIFLSEALSRTSGQVKGQFRQVLTVAASLMTLCSKHGGNLDVIAE
ncbi:hypothetical protein [Nonomuraea rosea]|uniref:hypothetical protein n=1 Tax=Nonomuraea rosea TaxID=638574 RepID=UPI0031E6D86A